MVSDATVKYTYSSSITSINAISIYNTLRTKFWGTAKLSDLTINQLKSKSVYAVVTLEDGKYTLSGSNGVFTLTGPSNKSFTFSISAR